MPFPRPAKTLPHCSAKAQLHPEPLPGLIAALSAAPACIRPGRYNPQRADLAPHRRLAGVRRLCHHPVILAGHPFPGGVLAIATAFSISHPDTGLDGNVGRGGGKHSSLARPAALHDSVGLAASGLDPGRGIVDLQVLRGRLQRRPTRRTSRTHPRTPRTAPDHIGDTRPGPASGLFGALMRDAGLERGIRTGGLLRADPVRVGYRGHHDPVGR
jgi:hypothetical protein